MIIGDVQGAGTGGECFLGAALDSPWEATVMLSDCGLLSTVGGGAVLFSFPMDVAVAVPVDFDFLLLYFCCFVVVSSFCGRCCRAALCRTVSLVMTMVVVDVEPRRLSCGARLEECWCSRPDNRTTIFRWQLLVIFPSL